MLSAYQALVHFLETSSYVLRAGLGPASGCEEPCLADQLFHFHQSLCVLAPISVGSCYALPVSPAIYGSPRQIQNYLKTVKGLEGYSAFEKNVDITTCVTLFIFYIMQALMAYFRKGITKCCNEVYNKLTNICQHNNYLLDHIGYMFRPVNRSSSGLQQNKSKVLLENWDPSIFYSCKQM